MRHTSTPPRQRMNGGFVDDICRRCREDAADHTWCGECRHLICARTECGCEGEATVR